MPYIYKITNIVNNKSYIGKTQKTITQRWKEHCQECYRLQENHRPLYAAMNKHGIENFSIETLEECPLEILNEREKYWIEYFGSFKYGYNATIGGDGKQYADYELIIQLYNSGKTNKEIHDLTNYDSKTILVALENAGITAKERQLRGRKAISHAVCMIDKDTNEELQVFSSISDAHRSLGKQASGHIGAVCLGKRQTAYGYKWKYI